MLGKAAGAPSCCPELEMTVTLELEAELDDRLRSLAEAEGLSVEEYVRRLIREAVPAGSPEPALALLRRWESHDATADPAVLDQRREDWSAFSEAMNRSHPSNRILFP